MTKEERSVVLAGREILVVEDQYFLADEICRALANAGAAIVGPFGQVSDGHAAVKANPNLSGAVLDVNLDGTMVFPIADALRARGIPFVFTTGYDEKMIPAAYGDVPRFEKPVDTSEVVRHLADRTRNP